jgi:hypothetical protein
MAMLLTKRFVSFCMSLLRDDPYGQGSNLTYEQDNVDLKEGVPLMLSPSTAALSHRKPALARTPADSRRAEGGDE